jgi:uncharacterized protein (DUF608 family)
MAKGITLQIRVTAKQLAWLAARAGEEKVTSFARDHLLKDAPKEVQEDKGEPLPKESA